MKKFNKIVIIYFIFSVLLFSQQKKITIPLSFDYYYTYDMLVQAIKALNNAYPKLTELNYIGKSDEGRDIWGITINNPKTGKDIDKPGIYVDGNIHGNEIQASEVCLYLAQYLLENYDKNQEIKELVDKKCFYIIPSINVDGRFHFFNDPNNSSSNRSLRIPKDDDNDGLIDEDYPDDLDGDGNICMMRKRDPFGKMKTLPDEPRLMVPIKTGEKGEWTLLGSEGIDNDEDGKYNEDSEGYVDGNRNWGYNWKPNYIQSGAGDYPFESKTTTAVAEFISKKPNICVVWAFHNNGGMYLRGPSSKEQGEYPADDISVYNYLGEQAERITPGYRYMISWKDLYTTYGDFLEWMCMTYGTYGFVGELFITESESFKSIKESKRPQGSTQEDSDSRTNLQKERLKFNDHLAQGELFKDWKPFKHPVYGDIEIGGWVKMSSRLPAPFMLKDLVHRNASSVIFSAKNTPEVEMEIFDVQSISKDLYRVRVRLINSKAIPTMSKYTILKKLYPMDILSVKGEKIKVVTGGKIQNLYNNEITYKEYKPEIQFTYVPGFSKVEHEFIVSGKGKIVITYNSRWAGKIEKEFELK